MDPALPVVACPPNCPASEFASEVYKLSEGAEKSASSTMAGLLKLQGELKQVEHTLHEVIRDKANTVAALSGLKHLTKNRFPTAVTKTVKMTCVLFVCLATLSTGMIRPMQPDNYASVVQFPTSTMATTTSNLGVPTPRTDAMTCLDNACAALKRGDHKTAAEEFRKAADSGCDPELCLGRLAECQYRLGQDTDALKTCSELSSKMPSSGWPQFVRGLVYERQGKIDDARYQYNVAAVKGHRGAKLKLSQSGGGK